MPILGMDKKPLLYKGKELPPPKHKPLPQFKIDDPYWRLNNLYHIVNKQGELVLFKMNRQQRHFYKSLWWFNLVLKSRQLGFTTAIELIGLDMVLFYNNITATVIAHKSADATKIMKEKILRPYMNLHPSIKAKVKLVKSNDSYIEFSNGSSFSVSTSARSGVNQFLHVSELGYTSVHHPERAKEILTGSLPTVHAGGYCFIESTAEGIGGVFYDLSQTAMNTKMSKRKLVRDDFKFHFYSWYMDKDNYLSDEDTKLIPLLERHHEYFRDLDRKYDIQLSDNQKAWYVSQENKYQDLVKQEHPSTPDEAFASSGEGRIFRTQMNDMRTSGRLTTVPHAQGQLVHTFWDVGISKDNATACVFMQNSGTQWKIIDYFEVEDKGLEEIIPIIYNIARQKNYIMGEWIGPHDMKKRDAFQGISLHRQIEKMGVSFKVVPRVHAKMISIQALRSNFSQLLIDEANCEKLVDNLDAYRFEWDAMRGVHRDRPFHGPESNGCDALQQWALYMDKESLSDGFVSHADSKKVRSNYDTATGRPVRRRRKGMTGYT